MMRQRWLWVILAVWVVSVAGKRKLKRDNTQQILSEELLADVDSSELEPCQCGVFMSQQVGVKERRDKPRGPPQGDPVVTYDTEAPSMPCGASGFKHCVSNCLDVILKYLPKAGPVICGAVERDVHREKAFLFIKNCNDEWMATNFSAGKEFCCTDGQHHKCKI